jgi:peptidoglycan/LPS O-acetylase OafA/YrhL
MVDLAAPVVQAPALAVLVAFAGLWYYRFGDLPPARAVAVVALASLFVVYSLVSLSPLTEGPVGSVAVLLAVLLVLAVAQYVRGRASG